LETDAVWVNNNNNNKQHLYSATRVLGYRGAHGRWHTTKQV